jgi:hypothetical protein
VCVVGCSSCCIFTDLLYSKSDATDIESFQEFKKFVEKCILLEKRSARPKKVMVWLDIEEVKRIWKAVRLVHQHIYSWFYKLFGSATCQAIQRVMLMRYAYTTMVIHLIPNLVDLGCWRKRNE